MVSAPWTVPPRQAFLPWAVPVFTLFLRTERSSDRLTDILHRNYLKTVRRGRPGPMSRNEALGEAQPPDF